MPIVATKQKTALYLGNKTYTPQKSFVGAGAGAGVHDRLVALTCARQQTNTPNNHITSHSYSSHYYCTYIQVLFACSTFFLQSSLTWKSDMFTIEETENLPLFGPRWDRPYAIPAKKSPNFGLTTVLYSTVR